MAIFYFFLSLDVAIFVYFFIIFTSNNDNPAFFVIPPKHPYRLWAESMLNYIFLFWGIDVPPS